MASNLATAQPTIDVPISLSIFVFGSFTVTINGQPLTNFRSNKTRAILIYLVLAQGRPVLRTTLAALLWQGYTEPSARSNLRQSLSQLRDLLRPLDLLEADHQTVRLRNDPLLLWCDALMFEKLITACQQHTHLSLTHCSVCQERLRQAATLYKGAFLEDFPTIDSAKFADWRQTQSAYFFNLLATLKAEIVSNRRPQGNLPPPLTPLVGRAKELAELTTKVMHPVYHCLTLIGPGGIGKSRLALALGQAVQVHFPDGVWLVELAALPSFSTALAEQAMPAEQATTGNELLATHQHHDRLAVTISTALGLALSGAAHPFQQLTTYLRHKETLLILDNFEHLSAGADFILHLLQEAPHIRIVVTSRHRLELQAQQLHRVEGLPLPPLDVLNTQPPDQVVQHYDSLQLFLERADNVIGGFTLNSANAAAAIRICYAVEGSPWGIGLAAALLSRQSPAEIVEALHTNYALLEADFRDLPARQRSAKAIFLTSWRLLTLPEAQTLARCAVFRGGFTIEAATFVAETSPAILAALADKSLLQATAGTRYVIHELVRQFAGEQLAENETEAKATHHRHAEYYLALLVRWKTHTDETQPLLSLLYPELENMEVAWQWALSAAHVPLLTKTVEHVSQFYYFAGFYHEAINTFQYSLDHLHTLLANSPMPQPALQHLLAHCLLRLSVFYNALAQPAEALQTTEEVLTWAQQLTDPALIVEAYNEMAFALWIKGEYDRQHAILETALALAQQHGLQREQAHSLERLGVSAQYRHDYATAQSYLQAGLALIQQTDHLALKVSILNNLGATQRDRGDFAQAAHYFQQNLALMRPIGAQGQIALATANLGTLWLLLGDHEQALLCLQEGHKIFTEQGAKRFETEALILLGMLFEQMGNYSVAATYCEQAITLASQHNYYHPHREAWLTLGHIRLQEGAISAAHAAYEEVCRLSQSAGIAAEVWQAEAWLAYILLAQHEKQAALAKVETVLAAFDPSRATALQSPQRILLACYRILAANADPRADDILQQAWALIQKQAAQINEPRLHNLFLTNIPCHREIVQAATYLQAPSTVT